MRITLAFLLLQLAGPFALAQGPSVSVKDVPVASGAAGSEDTTISIRKGDDRRPLDPDYQIVSGTQEIAGDPVAGLKESHDSWKAACKEWKKEMRELNGASLLSLNCGVPRAVKDASSRVTQTSTASCKLRVKVRE